MTIVQEFYLRNESEVLLKDMTSKDIACYSLAALAKLMPGCKPPTLVAEEHRPGKLVIHLGSSEIHASRGLTTKWFISPAGHRSLGAVVNGPFKVVEYIVKMTAQHYLESFLGQTYDCVA